MPRMSMNTMYFKSNTSENMTKTRKLTKSGRAQQDNAKVGQKSQSRSHDQNLWFHQKGLVIGNTCQILYMYLF